MTYPDFDTAFAIAMAISIAAGLMRGFAGVGSGMLMAPIFVLLFGPLETVAMVIMMEIIVTALFMPVGSWLIVSLDPELVGRGMAVIVLGFSIFLLIG